MKNGFKIFWTKHALRELEETINYLRINFSHKEIKRLSEKIEITTELISKNPFIFPKSEQLNIHKAIVLKYNTIYYRINNKNIEILSFFSNRQSPIKRKLK